MNLKTAASLFLLSLLTISLMPTVVSAQEAPQPLQLYTILTTPGGEIYFFLNRTAIPVAGHPVVVASQLVFFLSPNGYSVITEEDIKIAEVVVGGYAVIFGSLPVPDGVPEGRYWLKVAGSPMVGADAVVSPTTVYVAEDPSRFAVLVYRDLSQLVVNLTPIVVTSRYFVTTLNMTAIGELAPNYDPTDATLKVVLLKNETERFFVKGTIGAVDIPSPAESNFLSGATITRTAAAIEVTGTLKDFGLPSEDIGICLTIMNVPVVCAGYSVNVGIARPRTFTGLYVERGEPVGVGTYTLDVSEINVRLREEARIYPSSSITQTNTTLAGPPHAMNVGDAATLDLRNFVDGTRTIVVGVFVVQDGGLVPLGETQIENVMVTNGTASITVTLPPLPYGGRKVMLIARDSEWSGYALFDPEQAFPVEPYFEARAFDNAGNLIDPTFVPGEYIYIRGYGFMVENLTFILRVGEAEIPLAVVAGPLWNATTGDLGVVVQIPGDAVIADRASVVLVVSGVTEGNSYSLSGTVIYGTVRVYVNPVVVLERLDEPRLRLPERITRYPSGAEWLAEEMIAIETIEIFGFLPGTSVTVSLNGYTLIPATTLATGYMKREMVRTPAEIPYGDYYVVANGQASVTIVQIRSTLAAFVDDRLLDYGYHPNRTRLEVLLPAPIDLALSGLGFGSNSTIEIVVIRVGYAVPFLIEVTRANERGSFSYTLPLSALTPGLYIVEITDIGTNVTFEIEVRIAVLPVLTIKVTTAAGQFADLPVNVWVLVLLDGEGLAPENVYSYNLTGRVVYFAGAEYRVLTQLEFSYTGIPGLFHAVFVPGAELRGTNAAVLVTAEVRVHELTPVQRVSDIASFVVPPHTLEELTQAANNINERLNTIAAMSEEINERLEALSEAMAERFDALSAEIASATKILRTDIATAISKLDSLLSIASLIQRDVDVVKSGTEAIRASVSTIDARTGEMRALLDTVSARVDTIATKVDAIQTAIGGLATKSDVREARDAVMSAVNSAKSNILSKLEDVKSIAETAAGVRIPALIDVILTLAVLALAAYIAFARKG